MALIYLVWKLQCGAPQIAKLVFNSNHHGTMVCATLIYIVNRGYKAASDWWSPHSRTNKCCFCGSSWPKKSRHLPPPVPPRRCHKPWTCGTPGTLGWPICSISAATETPIDRLYGVILPGMWGIIMIWLVHIFRRYTTNQSSMSWESGVQPV